MRRVTSPKRREKPSIGVQHSQYLLRDLPIGE